MRIVGGDHRGRTLATPKSQAIRPTADRTRESLFNILSSRIDLHGVRVVDLFAGTGALGLEALSRGASFALFVEDSVEGRGLVRANVEAFGLTGRTQIFRRDATRLGPVGTMKPFDLAFADPPYRKGLGEAAAASLITGGWLKPGALFVLEEARGHGPLSLPGFATLDRREFGDSVLGFFERTDHESRELRT